MRTQRYVRSTTTRPVEQVWTEADEIAWRERFAAKLATYTTAGDLAAAQDAHTARYGMPSAMAID